MVASKVLLVGGCYVLKTIESKGIKQVQRAPRARLGWEFFMAESCMCLSGTSNVC